MDQSHNPNSLQPSEDYLNTSASPSVSAKRQYLLRTAKYWLCAGVGLMALSFAINFFLYGDGTAFVTNSMYVLTTLGTVCITKALVNVFN